MLEALPAGGKLSVRYAELRPSRPVAMAEGDSGMEPAVTTAEECAVPGLELLPEFVTAAEEEALLRLVDSRPWELLARRRVQHYGQPFNYLTRSVDRDAPTDPFPAELLPLVDRLQALPGVGRLDQLTVNEYTPGVGLSAHVDTHSAFGPAIVSLSLAGSASMTFRSLADPGQRRQRALALPPRSALLLRGEARLAWEHYIPHRKSDVVSGGSVVPRAARRVSFTFRLVRQERCACAWPQQCDDQQGTIPPTRAAQWGAERSSRAAGGGIGRDSGGNGSGSEGGSSSERSQGGGACSAATAGSDAARMRLEENNVVRVYDAIAGHFSSTRFSAWPRVREFIEALPAGAVVADVGCGNGKYFSVRRDVFVTGTDRSRGLAEVAARRLHPPPACAPPLLADVAVADGLHLPYRRACCDGVLCIAVLHHLATEERRVALLAQLAGVLAPGGRALVTVWATEQENMGKVAKWQRLRGSCGDGGEAEWGLAGQLAASNPSQDFLVPWHLPRHRADAAAAASSASAVDPGKNTLVFNRYYHLFGAGEVEGLVGQVAGCTVVDSFYDKDNWCVVFERTAGAVAPQ